MFGSGFTFGTPTVSQPAATASGSLFGQPTTTQTTSIFGAAPNQPVQQPVFGSTPLFGQAAATQPTTTASTGAGLFGTFGQPAATTTGGFGTAAKPPAFSFGAAVPSTSAAPSLFGSPATSVAPFGTVVSQPGQHTLFGQTAPVVTSAPSTSGMSLFGGAFGQPTAQVQPVNGTTIKFTPAQSTDTAQKGALSTTVTTKHMVITAMKEYEGKSLEELRLEDYMANRRGPAPGTTTTLGATGSLFGSTAATAAKPLFGSPAQPAQPTQQPSLFGAAQPAVPAATGFTFGGAPATSTGGGLFGTGAPTVSAAPAAAAPFSFGATTQAKPTLSLPTTSVPTTAFTFGTPQPAAQPQTAGLFGAKPATTAAPFGTTTTSTFGGAFGSLAQPAATTAAAPTSLFGTTSTAPAGGLFAPKPAAAAPFGFSTGAPTSFGQAAPTQTSLFPAVSAAPATGGLFGAPVPGAPTAAAAPFSFGGTPAAPFGAAATQPTAGALPLFGQTAGQTAFGSVTTGGGMFSFPTAAASTAPTAPAFGQPFAAAALPSNVETAATAMMQALVHQKLLSLARCQPAYSVLFREPVPGATETTGGTTAASTTTTRLPSGGVDLSTSAGAGSFGRSLLPSSDGLGNLRSSLSVASSLPQTTMTSRPHTTGSSLFELKPRFGSGAGTASRLGLTWTGAQPGATAVPGAARWSPGKLGVEPSASPRSVISPLSLAPRHSIRQLIPKRFSMTMDQSTADMSGTGEDGYDQRTHIVAENGRVPDLSMQNPPSAHGGALTTDQGLLGADLSVVRPDGPDSSFVERIPSSGGRSSSSLQLPSSTPLNPRPAVNITPGTTPRGRPDRHVPLIKIEEHQTPGGPAAVSSHEQVAWQDEFADEQQPQSQQSPESRQRSSVQRRQLHIQQSRPVLQRPGYSSVPRIADLQPTINENNEEAVEWFADEFQVRREGFGSVTFHGRVNITSLNLDQLIEIERGEIVVYPDETIKPPVGQGLNRPSTLALEAIFPEDKATREPSRSPEALSRYKDYLRELSGRLGAEFVDYRSETGCWMIKVPHFTRYGLLPTDGAVVGDSPGPNFVQQQQQQPPQQTLNFDRANTSLLTATGLAKFPSQSSETSFLRRTFTIDSNDVVMSENNQAASADVQTFLDRIERLQSKTERNLGSVVVVSADLSKQHSLERHVKSDNISSAIATTARQTSVVQTPAVPVVTTTTSSKRARRVQWPQSIPNEITIAPPPGLSGIVAAKKSTSGSAISLESVAHSCYYVRGRRCSFVPGMPDTKLLCVSPRNAKGNFFVHVATLSQITDRNAETSLSRFISRCVDVINSWSTGRGPSNLAGVFSALIDCSTSDCATLPFVVCAQKLFSLCAALWSTTDMVGEGQSWVNESIKRKVLEWLGQHNSKTASFSAAASAAGVISSDLLFGRRTDALRTIAATHPRLALILAQADGNPANLTLLLQQLSTWDQAGMLRRFLAADPTNAHLIALAANCPYLDCSSLPGVDPKPLAIQLFGREKREKFGWRSAMAAQLRYGPSALPSVPLADAIREFDAFQNSFPENYAPNALPPSSTRGLDAAAYNLLLAYSRTDLESLYLYLMRAVAAVQQSASENGVNENDDWALSGNGDILAWLLLRAFTIAGCFNSSQSAAYSRVSMVTAIKLAARSASFSLPSWNSITSVMAESLGRNQTEVDEMLKYWTCFNK